MINSEIEEIVNKYKLSLKVKDEKYIVHVGNTLDMRRDNALPELKQYKGEIISCLIQKRKEEKNQAKSNTKPGLKVAYSDLFNKYKSLLFVYIRTTGAQPYTSQICELAAVKFSLENGKVVNRGQMDKLIKLNPGVLVAEKFQRVLGFTSERLTKEGTSEVEVADEFYHILTDDEEKEGNHIVTRNTLVIAHHGQITFEFLNQMFVRFGYLEFMRNHDFLDTMTVLRDRRAGKGNLVDAFHEYGMQDKDNSNPAPEPGKTICLKGIDEVKHLAYVALKMDQERADLFKYVNLFGLKPNTKPQDRFPHVVYKNQTACEKMRAENEILPVQKIG